MGNCCAAPKSARPNFRLERPPLNKRPSEEYADRISGAAEGEDDLETAAESKRKLLSMLIFGLQPSTNSHCGLK